jgi:HlyD family secretion protein
MGRVIKMLVGILVLGGLGFGVFLLVPRDAAGKASAFNLVEITRGTIVDKALATGQIVPVQEIQVKSQISGIVKVAYIQVGDPVEPGDRLFQIIPDPTPLEVTEAERRLDLAEVAYKQAQIELERSQRLLDSGILARDKYDATREDHDQAFIQLELARERLALLKEGRVQRESGGVDSVIRAPAGGTVLERHVDPGDPVVPLTTYQEGTPLLTMADMGKLVFKGTVDEIDVGKLNEGMPVRIQIGALPDAEITGRLVRIAPKAREEEGSTLFDVEVEIEDSGEVVLRAGYSANANVIIQEKEDILILPERLVIFEDEQAFVELPPAQEDGEPERREVTIGLSDGLNVEVIAGLEEGSQVVERPPREIE